MEEVIDERQVNLTEQKWKVISERLAARFGFFRSNIAVKNFWSRQGRALTGVDERRNPNPDKMVTSKQNPEQRKRARQRTVRAPRKKSSEEGESDNPGHSDGRGEKSGDEEEEADDYDEGGPPTRRRKIR